MLVRASPPSPAQDPGGLPSRTGLLSATKRVLAGDPTEFHRRQALPAEARRTSTGARTRRASVLRTPAQSSPRQDGSLFRRSVAPRPHGARATARVAPLV